MIHTEPWFKGAAIQGQLDHAQQEILHHGLPLDLDQILRFTDLYERSPPINQIPGPTFAWLWLNHRVNEWFKDLKADIHTQEIVDGRLESTALMFLRGSYALSENTLDRWRAGDPEATHSVRGAYLNRITNVVEVVNHLYQETVVRNELNGS